VYWARLLSCGQVTVNDTTKIALQDLFDAVEGFDEYMSQPRWKRRKKLHKEWLDTVVYNSMALQDEIVQELNDGFH